MSAFQLKLFKLVENKNFDCINWSPDGRNILVQVDKFLAYISKDNELCKSKRYASFVRQLNLYNFKSVITLDDNNKKNANVKEYFNQYFVRSRPDLLHKISRNGTDYKNRQRRKAAKKNTRKDEDPDWHEKGVIDFEAVKIKQEIIDEEYERVIRESNTNSAVLSGNEDDGLISIEELAKNNDDYIQLIQELPPAFRTRQKTNKLANIDMVKSNLRSNGPIPYIKQEVIDDKPHTRKGNKKSQLKEEKRYAESDLKNDEQDVKSIPKKTVNESVKENELATHKEKIKENTILKEVDAAINIKEKKNEENDNFQDVQPAAIGNQQNPNSACAEKSRDTELVAIRKQQNSKSVGAEKQPFLSEEIEKVDVQIQGSEFRANGAIQNPMSACVEKLPMGSKGNKTVKLQIQDTEHLGYRAAQNPNYGCVEKSPILSKENENDYNDLEIQDANLSDNTATQNPNFACVEKSPILSKRNEEVYNDLEIQKSELVIDGHFSNLEYVCDKMPLTLSKWNEKLTDDLQNQAPKLNDNSSERSVDNSTKHLLADSSKSTVPKTCKENSSENNMQIQKIIIKRKSDLISSDSPKKKKQGCLQVQNRAAVSETKPINKPSKPIVLLREKTSAPKIASSVVQRPCTSNVAPPRDRLDTRSVKDKVYESISQDINSYSSVTVQQKTCPDKCVCLWTQPGSEDVNPNVLPMYRFIQKFPELIFFGQEKDEDSPFLDAICSLVKMPSCMPQTVEKDRWLSSMSCSALCVQGVTSRALNERFANCCDIFPNVPKSFNREIFLKLFLKLDEKIPN